MIRIHDLRRTKATSLAQSGTPMHTVRDVLNHSSLRTTSIYVSKIEGCELVRKALDEDAEKLVGG